jgi:hypothetical protein
MLAKAACYRNSAVKKPKSISHKTVPKNKVDWLRDRAAQGILDWRMPATLGESHDLRAWQLKPAS